ncbi:S-ribosylhomocysteine lyase [bioreactor metagenome]|uniref:S-ribosylhomocysteine lyase n=1 Tax=bioreactor metagenome TaxID=1076179 RepID=A0A645C8T4_9ZZZZ
MERIASFAVDHRKIREGIYISRTDGDIITFDLRMKRPNCGDVLETGDAHAIEHLGATYLRNSRHKDSVIYFGPMGCRTGFYLLTRNLSGQELIDLVVSCYAFIADFEGEIPGATEIECGNFRDMSLVGAKAEAEKYLSFIRRYGEDRLRYD